MSVSHLRLFVQPTSLRIHQPEPPEDDLLDALTGLGTLRDRANREGYRDGLSGQASRRELVTLDLVGDYDAGYRTGARLAAARQLAAAESDYDARTAALFVAF